MKPFSTLPLLLLCSAAFLSSCAATRIEPAVHTVLTETTEKLRTAKTIHVIGTREADPALLPPGATRESVTFDLEAIRPGNLEVKSTDANGTRDLIAGQGQIVCYDEKMKVYSTIRTRAKTIEALADEIEHKFGVKMVIAELLGEDPKKALLDGVISAKVVGDEMVGGLPCTHLSFTQEGLGRDLWIAKKDALPRQIVVTYTKRPGQPKRIVTITRWQLNAVLAESDFTFTPGRDARQVKAIR